MATIIRGGGGGKKTKNTKLANTQAENVKEDVLFVNFNGELAQGTMPNRGAVSQTIAPGGQYIVPLGYHDGTGVVTASHAEPSAINSGAGTSGATSGVTFGGLTVGAYYCVAASTAFNARSQSNNNASISGMQVLAANAIQGGSNDFDVSFRIRTTLFVGKATSTSITVTQGRAVEMSATCVRLNGEFWDGTTD